MPLYDLNLTISIILGAWRPQTLSLWGSRLYNLHVVILMILQSIFVPSQLTAVVFATTKDIPEFFEKLGFGLAIFMSYAKRLNSSIYQKKIMRITTMLSKNSLKAMNKDEHKIHIKYKRLSK